MACCKWILPSFYITHTKLFMNVTSAYVFQDTAFSIHKVLIKGSVARQRGEKGGTRTLVLYLCFSASSFRNRNLVPVFLFNPRFRIREREKFLLLHQSRKLIDCVYENSVIMIFSLQITQASNYS